jgi:hypothetical protein
MSVLSDAEISKLLSEPKILPDNFGANVKMKPKLGHNEWEYQIIGEDGSVFYVILRSNKQNPMDFSVILGYQVPKTNVIFRLRRYNGKSHEHTNKIERQTFYDFHIHRATERYQLLGLSEETFAEPSNRYSDWNTALTCLLDDCGFVTPPNPQLEMWK